MSRAPRVLVRCIERFRTALQRDLGEVLAAELRGFRPTELREVFDELGVVTRQLAVRQTIFSQSPSDPWLNTTVHEVHARLLERVVVAERRALAQEGDLVVLEG